MQQRLLYIGDRRNAVDVGHIRPLVGQMVGVLGLDPVGVGGGAHNARVGVIAVGRGNAVGICDGGGVVAGGIRCGAAVEVLVVVAWRKPLPMDERASVVIHPF